MKVKVYFMCQWDAHLLKRLKNSTPGSLGSWKNIEGVSTIRECDYIVVLDDLDNATIKAGKECFIRCLNHLKLSLDRVIYFQRENTGLLNKRSWFHTDILVDLKHNYSYENSYFYTFTSAQFINMTYDELKQLTYDEAKMSKTKCLSAVVSSKNNGKTYLDRIKFLSRYSQSNPGKVDIYGKGWARTQHQLGDNYKGELGSYHQDDNCSTSKADGLKNYAYSLCLENYPDDELISEKITDALLLWAMPIYSGSKSTCKYLPKEAFHLIDVTDPDSVGRVEYIVEHFIAEENVRAMRKARNLILDKYNIWEQVRQIIDDTIKYKIAYNFNLSVYFCHYPKTGGTYVKNIIYGVENGVDHITDTHIKQSIVAKQFKQRNIDFKILPHDAPYKQYVKPNTLLFTSVRNPTTLVKSYYSHGQLGFQNVLKDERIKSFGDFFDLFMSNNPYPRFTSGELYKDMFVNGKTIYDTVLRLEHLEADLKCFFDSCGIDYSQVNFDLSDYNRNKYTFKGWVDKDKRNHKNERKSGLVITGEMKTQMYDKYKHYFDYYGYDQSLTETSLNILI